MLNNEYVHCSAIVVSDSVKLVGKFIRIEEFDQCEIFAANPIDRMSSYSGSGLPFPCSAIAFDSSPNRHIQTDPSGEFTVHFKYPNSYYLEDARTVIPPAVFFIMKSGNNDPVYVRFDLPQLDPLLNVRTLGYRKNHSQGPSYYSLKEQILGIPDSAEMTMRAYKNLKIFKDLA